MASQYYFGQSGTEVTRSQLRSFKRQYRQYRRAQFKEYQRTVFDKDQCFLSA